MKSIPTIIQQVSSIMGSRKTMTKRNCTFLIDSIAPKKTSKTDTGSVFACGQNNAGQLGIGVDEPQQKIPTLVENLTDIVNICAGGMHTLCIDENGKVYSWGCNDEFALGRFTTFETEAIPGEVNLDEKVVQITAGDSHSAALTETGKVYAWGSFRDSHGSMGLTTNGKQKEPTLVMENAAKIASGSNHLLILSTAGLLYSLGCAEQGQLGRIANRFADRGSRRGLGVERKQTIYTWPVVSKPFSTGKKLVSICGGDHHTLALDNEGKTYVLGRKEYGRLGLGEDCDDVQKPTLIPGLINEEITSIACGSCVSFAVTREGKAYSWGMGTNYQLGNDSKRDFFFISIPLITAQKFSKMFHKFQ